MSDTLTIAPARVKTKPAPSAKSGGPRPLDNEAVSQPSPALMLQSRLEAELENGLTGDRWSARTRVGLLLGLSLGSWAVIGAGIYALLH